MNPSPTTSIDSQAVWLGLDVGGANCKWASSQGSVEAWPFPLWKDPDGLGQRLRESILGWTSRTGESLCGIAVTMTGELADCYWTRQEGVERIVEQVALAAGSLPFVFYGTDQNFYSHQTAPSHWLALAASNWHATASWLCSSDPLSPSIGQSSLLIDIGSTTTDLIPMLEQKVVSVGKTDRQRMASGELVYTGLQRTAIASIVRRVRLDQESIRVSAETFATAEDAHRLLGHVADEPERFDTADGRAATLEFSHGRLARMIGEDAQTLSLDDARTISEQIVARQVTLIRQAIDQVASRLERPCESVVIGGHGGVLAQRALDRSTLRSVERFNLQQSLGGELSRALPAYAVARLAQQAIGFEAKAASS